MVGYCRIICSSATVFVEVTILPLFSIKPLLPFQMCQEKAGSDSHGAGSGGAGAGGGAGGGAAGHGAGAGGAAGHGAGAGGAGAGAGAGGAGGAGAGGAGGVMMGASGAGSQMFAMGGMNGMQLPFPFFPPFACDVECVPYQMQVVQQQQVPQPVPQPAPKTTTHAPSKRFRLKALGRSTVERRCRRIERRWCDPLNVVGGGWSGSRGRGQR